MEEQHPQGYVTFPRNEGLRLHTNTVAAAIWLRGVSYSSFPPKPGAAARCKKSGHILLGTTLVLQLAQSPRSTPGSAQRRLPRPLLVSSMKPNVRLPMRAGSTQRTAEAPGAQTINSKRIIIPEKFTKQIYLLRYCVPSSRFCPTLATRLFDVNSRHVVTYIACLPKVEWSFQPLLIWLHNKPQP